MRTRRVGVFLMLAAVAATVAPAHANVAATINLEAPAEAAIGSAVPVAGTLSLAGVPLPLQSVKLLVDGGEQSTVQTGLDGSFSGSVVFNPIQTGSLSARSVAAAWLTGPVESRATRMVEVKRYVPPSTPLNLLSQALQTKEIDYPTSLLYRAWATFRNERLPEKYRGDFVDAEDHDLIPDVQAAWSSIPTATKNELQPYLVRPTDPTSALRSARPASGPLADGDCVSGWASKASQGVRVWDACGPDDTTYEAEIDQVLSWAATDIFPREKFLMGSPLKDNDVDGPEIDVYLLSLAQCRQRGGACVKVKTEKEKAWGMAVRADKSDGLKTSGYVLIDREGPQKHATLVHELFHVLQYSHNSKGVYKPSVVVNGVAACSTSHWFVEASAQWSEFYFEPNGQNYSAAVTAHPDFSTVFQKTGGPINEQCKRDRMYPSYIWPFFMQQVAGATAANPEVGGDKVAAIWTEFEGLSDWAAMDAKIDAQLPFSSNMRKFALRNLNDELLPGDPIKPRYKDLDPQFPDGVQPWRANLDIADTVVTLDKPVTLDTSIEHLQSKYFLFGPPTSAVREIVIDATGIQPEGSVDVDAVVKIANKEWIVGKDFPTSRKLRICVAAEPLEQAWIVVSNHERDVTKEVAGRLIAYGLPGCTDAVGIIGASEVIDQQFMNGSRHYEYATTLNMNLSLTGRGPGAEGYENNGSTWSITVNGDGSQTSSGGCVTEEHAHGADNGTFYPDAPNYQSIRMMTYWQTQDATPPAGAGTLMTATFLADPYTRTIKNYGPGSCEHSTQTDEIDSPTSPQWCDNTSYQGRVVRNADGTWYYDFTCTHKVVESSEGSTTTTTYKVNGKLTLVPHNTA